jgi:hypothetical protein
MREISKKRGEEWRRKLKKVKRIEKECC